MARKKFLEKMAFFCQKRLKNAKNSIFDIEKKSKKIIFSKKISITTQNDRNNDSDDENSQN